MTDEGTCVSPACVKQETPANEAIRPKIEFDELVDNAFFVKEEEEPPKTVGHLHGDSTINPTPTTILGGKAARNIKEEEEEQAESIKSDLTDDDSEEIKEEIDEIKYTESEVCDNKIKDTISCDGDNVNSMQDSTNKQEGHNGKTRSKRRHNLLIIETTTNGNATISTPKKRPKNHLSVEQKNQILNTFKAYTSSHPENIKVQNVKFTARATGFCESTVYKVLKEDEENQIFSPPKPYHRPKPILDNITVEQKALIRRIIHSFFLSNEPPTAAKILNAVNEHEDLPNLKKSTLKKLLKSLNFRYKGRGRNILKEKDEIINRRRRYLREIKNYTEQGRKIYYLDETWLNAEHTVSKAWPDTSVLSARDAFIRGLSTGLKEPSGKGRQQGLVVLHVGSDDGFVENGLLILQSKKKGVVRQEEMTSEVFEGWFKRILPNLEGGSVIVMDDASHHTRKIDRVPTSGSKKLQVQEWLRSKNVPFEENMVKAELLALVKRNQNKPPVQKYVVDELAKADREIVILRLPPYHCELNPIESIWAQIKDEVARKNTTFKLNDVETLFREVVGNVTSEDWKRAIQRVAFFRDKLWEVDDLMEMQVEPLISNLQSDSSSESDTE